MKLIKQTNLFKRDFKIIQKRNKDLRKFDKILELLVKGQNLPIKYHPHKLSGHYFPKWECYIEPDWLLIYEVSENFVVLCRTGTHSDLFK